MKRGLALLFLVSLVVLYSCQKEEQAIIDDNYSLQLPSYFPKAIIPDDNQLTKSRVILGKMLFNEKLFALDSSISCASCHKSSLAFADNSATSTGSGNLPGTRNSPSLANVLFQPYLLREGGVPTLEMQVLVPIQEHNEFDNNILQIIEKLKDKEDYKILSLKAYDRPMDAFVVTRALAAFQRTLISSNSPYDAYLSGKQDALSYNALQGRNLFFDSLKCGQCHSGPLLTNFAFENNGMYKEYTDIGRERFTRNAQDRGKFKVPSLRNVGLTAPYMFDGSLITLNDVLDHYVSGGRVNDIKSEHIVAFSLSNDQRIQLLAFLESLTDYKFINNKAHQF
jgi:cytochrome c peroxidase